MVHFRVCVHLAEDINIPLLRRQQIRLGLLKAARVLFSLQDNLRQIMGREVSEAQEEKYSLFQQLLGAATRPSPIKAIFGKDELEVREVGGVCMEVEGGRCVCGDGGMMVDDYIEPIMMYVFGPYRQLLCLFVST